MDLETFPTLLHRNRRQHGREPAVVTWDRSITHAELEAASAAAAGRLVAAGVAKSSRVGLLAPNGIDWVVSAAAVLRIGAVLVPLSTLLRPPELEEQLRTADVTHLVAARSYRGRDYVDEVAGVASRVPSLRAVWGVGELPPDSVAAELVGALESRVRAADDLSILFTSGSTGPPKGVVHTHGAALRAVAAGLDARCIGAGARVYLPMPLFWTGGFAAGLMSTLVAGATLLTEAVTDPHRTLAFLERERATLFRGWPDQAATIAAHPRFATTELCLGDASLPAMLPTERRPPPGARPNVFGMTETFGPWCGDRLDVDMPVEKWGSCGRPFAGVEVRVVDDEIHVRGPNLLRTVCGREGSDLFTVDGWFPTGDRGRLDRDGYLWYEGRLDDMFKVKGASVYPSEVEAALRAVEGVRQAHVTEIDGEVGALVVTDAGLDAVITGVRSRLSAFKVPARWLVTTDAAEIPMTPTGKVDKRALRARLHEEELS